MMKISIVVAAAVGFALSATMFSQAQNGDEAPANPLLASEGMTGAPQQVAVSLASGETISVASRDGRECALDSLGSGPCAGQNVIDRGTAIEMVPCEVNVPAGKFRIVGLAPSTATGVSVRYENGSSYPGAMANGAFGIESPSPHLVGAIPTKVEYTLEDGTVTSAPVPADREAFMTACG